jgi:PST family polysaccharide transporter
MAQDSRNDAFGLVAMVAVVLTFLEHFKDLGLSAATVQRDDISQDQVSVLFWINAGLGLAAAAIACALAPALAAIYGRPELQPVTLWLAVGFVFSGLGTQHLALLRRQMRFGALAGVQLAADAIGILVAIVAALMGAGFWSLVWQRLAWALALTLGAWLACEWRPGLPRRNSGAAPLIGFGGNVTGANLINFAVRNLDLMLIGWWWGSMALGLYERSNKLLLMPINTVNAPLYAVTMPTLSRLTDQPELYRRTYITIVEKLAMISTPLGVVLITAPEAVVHTLFGPGWTDAAPIVGWIGVAVLYQPVTYTCSWLFMSQARTAVMLRWSLIGSGLTAAAIIAAVPLGPVAVAASYSVSGLLVRLPALFWMVGREGPVEAKHIYGAVLPSACVAAISIAALSQFRQIAITRTLAPFAELALVAAMSVAVAMLCFAVIPRCRRALVELARLPAAMMQRERSA